MSGLIWLLYIVAALFLLQYVLGPILVRFAVVSPRNPEIRRLDPTELDPEIRAYFESVHPELTTLGFRPAGHFLVNGFTRGQVWHLAAYLNDRTLDGASANFVFQEVPKGEPMRARVVAFLSDFEGGRMVGTSNSLDPTPFVRDSSLLEEHIVPGEEDLLSLYRVHRITARAFGGGRPQRRPAPGTELEALRDSLRRQMEARVDSGHFRLDELAGHYRLTWSGALLSTWSLLWPWKPLRVARARRRARRLLAGAPEDADLGVAAARPAPEPVGAE